MTQSFTPELKRLLQAAGCRFVRAGKGDHEIWHSPITELHFAVDGRIKSCHTANAVLERPACRSISNLQAVERSGVAHLLNAEFFQRKCCQLIRRFS